MLDATQKWRITRVLFPPPPGQLIKPRHNLKLIARQMEVVVSITGWLGDLTATIQFVIKIIYVMASQYRASLI